MSARKYRLGRMAAWLLSLLGWGIMAGGGVAVALGMFQVIAMGTRDLATLAPYLGGGFAVLLNGLFMVAGAQLMLAVFDIALSGRALVLSVPGQPAAPASGAARRPTSTTFAPSAENRRAAAAPMPVPAPVTITVLSSKRVIRLSFSVACGAAAPLRGKPRGAAGCSAIRSFQRKGSRQPALPEPAGTRICRGSPCTPAAYVASRS